MTTFWFLATALIPLQNTYCESINEERSRLNQWISTLSTESLAFYRINEPWRLRTSTENIIESDQEIANLRRDTPKGVYFSGSFTNNAVLQREPHIAAIYGGSNSPFTKIVLTMIDETTNEVTDFSIITMDNGDWKLLLPQTHPNGGNFTFNVSCSQCFNASSKPDTFDVIYNVTFGDVYYCAGQSNMELAMHHTFSRNLTYSNITKLHKYSNIRFFMKSPIFPSSPMFVYPVDTKKGPSPHHNKGQYEWHKSVELEYLDSMAASCWYFAQSLHDDHGLKNITLGMMSAAVGGSTIESWIANDTVPHHCNGTMCPGPGCGGNYNGMLSPFINTTIKGVLWYQGENDVGHYPAGSWLNGTGYGCLEPLMVDQWRSQWSVAPKTTNEMVHFGFVTLASGTSEGHQAFMGGFRWAQTANFGILPNAVMPNTFVALGHGIGDPWGKKCGEHCQYPAPYNYPETPWLDGPVHPRPKIYVGQRLARGAAKFIYDHDIPWTGPVIASCQLNGGEIVVNFNQSLLQNEEVFVKPFKLWYNESITPKHVTSLQVLVNETDWEWVSDEGVRADDNGYSVRIDVSEYTGNGGKVSGLRYAWTDNLDTSPCCGDLDITVNPCPMDSCPIKTSKSGLPAPPFWAEIVDGKCKCFAPQQCG